jgi:hypothetical protein
VPHGAAVHEGRYGKDGAVCWAARRLLKVIKVEN